MDVAGRIGAAAARLGRFGFGTLARRKSLCDFHGALCCRNARGILADSLQDTLVDAELRSADGGDQWVRITGNLRTSSCS